MTIRLKRKQRFARRLAHGTRRRGSVLILVTALLGMLFVMGVAFMGTMNFYAETIDSERSQAGTEGAVDGVFEEIGTLLAANLVPNKSVPFGAGDLYGGSAVAFAELPGYHNIFSSLEPDAGVFQSNGQVYQYQSWLTDIPSLQETRFYGSKYKNAPLLIPAGSTGAFNGMPTFGLSGEDWIGQRLIDADGDGIGDSFEFNVSEGLDLSEAQLKELAKALNPEGREDGDVFMGLRILPHGGMVNLNDAHPLLVQNIFPFDQVTHGPSQPDARFYSSQTEEPLLRRRNFLPPRIVPPSKLHGNMFLESGGDSDGNGDFSRMLFPLNERVFEGEHRYYPFSYTEMVDPNASDGAMLWGARMSFDYIEKRNQDSLWNEYDSRHLATTISHDDLLARGAVGRKVLNDDTTLREVRQINVLSEMLAVAEQLGPEGVDYVPFEYVRYPFDLGDQDCENPTNCNLDPRQGRLQLSLPYLDRIAPEWQTDISDKRFIAHLIYDVFVVMLYNASGAEWEDQFSEQDSSSFTCEPHEYEVQEPSLDDPDVTVYACYDRQLRTVTDNSTKPPQIKPKHNHRLANITRTAASLTANLLDFVDTDESPTRIELRPVDFSYPDSVGRWKRQDIAFAPAGGFVDRTYVYGLERQLFITEVAVDYGTDPIVPGEPNEGYAIELFNPNDATLTLAPNVWSVRINDEFGEYGGVPGSYLYTLPGLEVPAYGRVVIRWNPLAFSQSGFGISPSATILEAPVSPALTLIEGDIVYLTRKQDYLNPIDGSIETDEIVVDQFEVNTGNQYFAQIAPGVSGLQVYHYSQERPNFGPPDNDNPTRPWYAALPAKRGSIDHASEAHSLGAPLSATIDAERKPVEVRFAGTGEMKTAFPTTGSLLMLMRYASRSWSERNLYIDDDLIGYTPQVGNLLRSRLAWTSHLAGRERTRSTSGVGYTLVERQIDNGRMPVFDRGYSHHEDQRISQQNKHNDDPSGQVDIMPPGDLNNLPWGQLVFDYFTALPLSSPGPYRDRPSSQPDVDHAAGPRVDMNGLRVHGRININAAPIPVLAGLPLMPANSFINWPVSWQSRLAAAAGLDTTNPALGTPLGYGRAKAIVAYRDQRELFDLGDTTGNYSTYRGWKAPNGNMFFRRGTGYLSVGELFNVRNRDATIDQTTGVSEMRMDRGYAEQSDYLSAIATMVVLGDWVSVRSHVFTIYGVLRGEADQTIGDNSMDESRAEVLRQQDIDSRAIRFQETVDRLPVFTGERLPAHVGERVISSYSDALND